MELFLINMRECIYRSQGERASHYHAFFVATLEMYQDNTSKVTNEGYKEC